VIIPYEALQGILEKEARELAERMRVARVVAASQGVKQVQPRIPKAFGHLRDSVEATENGITVTAPHAAAVEIGTRPHYPDIEALTRWVKLRGMQGLTPRGRVRKRIKNLDPKSAKQAQSVARQLKSLRAGSKYSLVDAPRQIAEAIAKRIQKFGTKPVFYMRSSVPSIAANLIRLVRKFKARV